MDNTIKNEVPNDLSQFSNLTMFCNGSKAYKYFTKYNKNLTATKLTSSSGANCWKKELVDLHGWEVLRKYK